MEERIGFKHAQRPEVGQLSRSFQSNQPIPNPSRERTGRPVVKDDTRTRRKTSRSQEIDVNSFLEDTVSSERTERPVVETSVIQTRSSEDSKDTHVEMAHERTRRLVVNYDDSSHEQTMLNEVNMDFRIPGIPHSVVKLAQSTSVAELIQKIALSSPSDASCPGSTVASELSLEAASSMCIVSRGP